MMIEKNTRIDFSSGFLKQLKKAPIPVKIRFRDRLQLFRFDRFHPQLNNHNLTGKYKGWRSINITGDWRAVFREFKDSFYFDMIGTHSQLYG